MIPIRKHHDPEPRPRRCGGWNKRCENYTSAKGGLCKDCLAKKESEARK